MGEPPRRMITGNQIRAALGLIDWDVPRLARDSRVSESTIRRAMAASDVPRMRSDNLLRIQRALESGGCMFLDPDDTRTGGEGVRLRRRT
jgi:hypothetical protein